MDNKAKWNIIKRKSSNIHITAICKDTVYNSYSKFVFKLLYSTLATSFQCLSYILLKNSC